MKNFSFLFSIILVTTLFAGCKNDTKHSQAGMIPRGEQSAHLDRFEQEIQQFEVTDKQKMPPEGAVLFTGSSSIRLWQELEKDFEPVPVINRGFGGSTLPEVIHYAERAVFKYKPSLIVLYCGENDIAEGDAPPVVFQHFKKFIGETEKNLEGTPVIFISAKPSPSHWNQWREMQQFNSMVKQFAENRPNLRYVEVSGVMMGKDGQPDPAIFTEDKLHMNRQGYERWLKVLKPVVQELYTTEQVR